jgi:hypothetical protein
MDDALKLAVDEYQQATKWAETCRENSGRIERELTLARDRAREATDKMYSAHQNLMQVALLTKL